MTLEVTCTGMARELRLTPVQNHLLQLLCLTAMEPPVAYDGISLRNETFTVLYGMRHRIVCWANTDQDCRTVTRCTASVTRTTSLMLGNQTLFPRSDWIYKAWSIVDPIIQHWESHPPKDLPNYPAGSWGPAAANTLLKRDGRAWDTT
jgi:glucose-6-phosphate 1-dehydrogenase